MEPSNNPLSPEDVAAETIACNREGASMVHLHVRDKTGAQTGDLTHYTKTLNLIRDKSDIIIQGSTGGLSDLSLEERCVSLEEPRTQVASLNMGSTNVADTVYINTMEDIRYWAKRMKETDVIPKMEIFTLGMYTSVQKLVEEGLLPEDPEKRHYNFALGFDGALPADIQTLSVLKSRLPASASFGVLHEGFDGFAFLAGAVALGANSIRVGFEDGAWLSPGIPAVTNAELVKKAVEMLDILGCEPMSSSEAGKHLGVRRL
jgi:3-keto-5-aminohexanoate cleavage enzyme